MTLKTLLQRTMWLPLLLLGIAIFAWLLSTRAPPERSGSGEERPRAVRSVTVAPLAVTPQLVAWGTLRPARVWSGVSEVGGRIIELPATIRPGMSIAAGALLAAIDPTDYQLALEQAEANLAVARAQLTQLEAQEVNLRASLEIEALALESSQKELTRNRDLARQGSLSQNALETQQRNTLAQQQKVQSLRNSLDLLPSDRLAKQAQILQLQAQRELAGRNLQRTRLYAPFDGRIAELRIEEGQYVRQGEQLIVIDERNRYEVTLAVAPAQLAQLVAAPLDEIAPQQLKGWIELAQAEGDQRWPVEVVRFEAGLDAKTRTIGVVVAIRQPGAADAPIPLLRKGHYLAVTLQGVTQSDQIVLPRQALHGREVWVVNSDDRLEPRAVEIGIYQRDYVTLRRGVAVGERVVVSDLVPAVTGMLLAVSEDHALWQRLERMVAGSGE
jgi:RND family efflux transporter MFP subunit